MKRFALVAAVLLCGSAYAQPPEEVTADDTISLNQGQSKVVAFDQSVTEIKIASDKIARVRPLTDRTFVIEAAGGTGETMAIAYGQGGKEVHRFNIGVAGHEVKIYGQKPPLNKSGARPGDEYDSYICTDHGCGRVNQDVEYGPSAVSVSDTKQDNAGNSRTVTKEYR